MVKILTIVQTRWAGETVCYVGPCTVTAPRLSFKFIELFSVAIEVFRALIRRINRVLLYYY